MIARRFALLSTLVMLPLALLYWFPLRRWFARWGTTPDDLTRGMAGDNVIVNPTHSATHAVTVNAPPEDIWPWLVQMGYQRGGLYSYDWLDRLFGFLDRPSANRVLPEFQHLSVGDKVRLGPRRSRTREPLPVGRAPSATCQPLRPLRPSMWHRPSRSDPQSR